MSAPYSSIRSAFVQRLQLFPSLPPVAWENVPFYPAAGVSYLKPELLPAEPVQAGIGLAAQNMHPGIYQISIWTPSGVGVLDSNTLRDALLDHFKRGTVITYMGVTVTITKAFIGPTIQETDWQHVPLTIQFRAYAAN